MFEKTKKHFKEHRELYFGIGIGLATTGIAAITWLIMKESSTKLQGGLDSPDLSGATGSFIFGNNSGKVVTTVHNGTRGNSGYITRCVETGELFETQGAAAKAFDIPESILSKHLNRGYILEEGLTFERLGVLS